MTTSLERVLTKVKANFINFCSFCMFVNYLIDPFFIIVYKKKNFEILTNFTRTRLVIATLKITSKIAKVCKFAVI